MIAPPSIANDCQEIPETETIAEINHAFSGLVKAARSLDTKQYFNFFDHERYTALNSDGSVTHSFLEFQKNFSQQIAFIEAYKTLQFHNVKITVLDCKTALLINEYSATIKLKSNQIIQAEGAGTQLWSKKSGHWKLLHVAGSEKPTD